MIEIYEFALSGNCHKVRLVLSLLGLAYLEHSREWPGARAQVRAISRAEPLRSGACAEGWRLDYS
jgi:glutathione S-transferase